MGVVFISLGLFLGYLTWLGAPSIEAAGSLAKTEVFTASDPYYKWLGALLIIWAIGLIPDMRGISVAFLTLVLLALALSHSSGVTALEKAL